MAGRASLGYIPAVMDEREAFRNFAEAMKIAAASCKQLAFMRQDPMFIKMEVALEGARKRAVELMNQSGSRIIRPTELM